MWDLEHLYVKKASFSNCTAGEFTGEGGLDTTALEAESDVIQTIEILTSSIKKTKLLEISDEHAVVGKRLQYGLYYQVESDFGSGYVKAMDSLQWKSSVPNAAEVDENGTVILLKSGTVTLTAGSKTKSDSVVIHILPKAPEKVNITKIERGKKKLKISWKKVSGVTGYEIVYGSDPDGWYTKTKKVSGSKTSVTLSKLSSKTKYYIKVRAHIKVDEGTSYGEWIHTSKKTK